MIYQEFNPDPALRPYVRCLYSFCGEADDSGGEHTFRFPSDGGPELIVNTGDPFVAGTREDRLQTFSGGHIIGPLSRHLLTRTTGHTAFVAVRFRPAGMAPFFQVPSHELTDRSVDIETFRGRWGGQLAQRVRDVHRPADAVEIIQTALRAGQSPRFSPDRRMNRAIDAVFVSRGLVRVDRMADVVGLSRRQFERRFIRLVGLSPKRLCRIVRFAAVCRRIGGEDRQGWAQTALDAGYSDQAHLIRECRFFTGFSPEAYLKHRSPLEDMIFNSSAAMSHFFNTRSAASAILPSKTLG